MDDSQIPAMLAKELASTLKRPQAMNGKLENYASDLTMAFATFCESKGWPLEAILKNDVRQGNLVDLFSIGREFEALLAKHGAKDHPLSEPLSNAIDSLRIKRFGSLELASKAMAASRNELSLNAGRAVARIRRTNPPVERTQLKQTLYSC
jgi:hypothetical protein